MNILSSRSSQGQSVEQQPPVSPYEGWTAEMPAAPPTTDAPIEHHAAEPLAVVNTEGLHPPAQTDEQTPAQPSVDEEAEKATRKEAKQAEKAARAARKQADAARKAQEAQDAADAAAEAEEAARQQAQATAATATAAPQPRTAKQRKKADKKAAARAQSDLDELINATVSGEDIVLDEAQFAAVFGSDANPKFVETGKAVGPVYKTYKKSGKAHARVAKFAANGLNEDEPVADNNEAGKEESVQARLAKKLGRALLRGATRGKLGVEKPAEPVVLTPEQEKAARKAAKKAARKEAEEAEAAKPKKKKASEARKNASSKRPKKTPAEGGHWAVWEARQLAGAVPTLDQPDEAEPTVIDLPDQSKVGEPVAVALPARPSRFAQEYIDAHGGQPPASVQGDLDTAVAEIKNPTQPAEVEAPDVAKDSRRVFTDEALADLYDAWVPGKRDEDPFTIDYSLIPEHVRAVAAQQESNQVQPATSARAAHPAAKVAMRGSAAYANDEDTLDAVGL